MPATAFDQAVIDYANKCAIESEHIYEMIKLPKYRDQYTEEELLDALEKVKFTYLDNWSLHYVGYTCPDFSSADCITLKGNVFNHPEKEDDDYVRTSTILETKGRLVKTRSRWYLLHEINPEYLQWLADNNYKYNWRRPLNCIN